MRVRGITLGCKVNTYETEYILLEFQKKGYEIVKGESDIYIINTCSVTNTSDSKSRKIINRIARENKDSVIVVMGCMIEAHKDYENPLVSIIIGNKDKSRVVSLVEKYLKEKERKKILYPDFDLEFEDMFIEHMSEHTRAFVKIQDGCENFCSYCIIPYTRGKQRSKKPEKVLEEISLLVQNGYQEIVLTGIHTGHYGSDIETSFSKLLREIVKIKGLKRLRISSIEITELNDDFLSVLEEFPQIVSHLHIPLQAGSDTILKSMNRKYDLKYYFDKLETIRSIRKDISITTDIIVGFPGETEEMFLETLENAKKLKFTKIHVFPYSRREGTKADLMPNQIKEDIKKDRVKRLMALSDELEKEYLDSFIGQTLEVLTEENKDLKTIGHTGNYLKVEIEGEVESNKIVMVKITDRENNILKGELDERVE